MGIMQDARNAGKSLSEHEHDLKQQYQEGKLPLKRTPTVMETVTVRPEVAAFALAMEAKLAKNDFKGHWAGTEVPVLFDRCLEEAEELQREIFFREDPTLENVMDEAVDVANLAMMIFDNARNKRW